MKQGTVQNLPHFPEFGPSDPWIRFGNPAWKQSIGDSRDLRRFSGGKTMRTDRKYQVMKSLGIIPSGETPVALPNNLRSVPGQPRNFPELAGFDVLDIGMSNTYSNGNISKRTATGSLSSPFAQSAGMNDIFDYPVDVRDAWPAVLATAAIFVVIYHLMNKKGGN